MYTVVRSIPPGETVKDSVASFHIEECGVTPAVIARAPAVGYLLGEHTELVGGRAISFGLPHHIYVALSPRKDNSLRFYAADSNERKRSSLVSLKYKREDRWANHIKGIISLLLEDDAPLKGMDITLYSTIPLFLRPSQNAPLEVAAALAVDAVFGLDLSREYLLGVIRESASEFLNHRVNGSDHYTSLFCVENCVGVLDTHQSTSDNIGLDLAEYALLVTNAQVPLNLTDADFEQRRNDCYRCEDILRRKKAGTALRLSSVKEMREHIGILPENIRRRCMHVVEENQRIIDGQDLLKKQGYPAFGKLMNRSHESLRDLYEVSCPELDWLVRRSIETDGVYGSRLMGTGPGGCTITLMRRSQLGQVQKHLEDYERIFGFKPESFFAEPSKSAELL